MPYKDPMKKRLHDIWSHMRTRCNNSNNEAYKYYGEKGIKVCQEWESSFYTFYYWALKNGYSQNLTIDRIDNNKNYCPENCRWVDMKVQANNKTSNHLITYLGETKTMQQWAEKYNLNITTISERLRNGCEIGEELFLPVENYEKIVYSGNKKYSNGHYITFNGEEHTISEWAKIYGMTRECLRNRINKDKSPIDKIFLSQDEYKKYRKERKILDD